MGWYFTHHQTRADLVHELTQGHGRQQVYQWSNDQQKYLPLDYEMSCRILDYVVRREGRRDVLWTVEEYTYHVSPPTQKTMIVCHLLCVDHGGWGYKPMDEYFSPYYYSCPLEFLDQAPEISSEWRRRVRDYHGEQKPMPLHDFI